MNTRELGGDGQNWLWRALAAVVVLVGLAGRPARAAVFAVNDFGDAVDALPGDGVCATITNAGVCTLRAAIQESNVLPGPDTIMLPSGNITLAIAGTGEDAAAQGDLDILGDLDIRGVGPAHSIIDGAALDRVFDCAPGALAGSIHVRLAGLKVRNGRADVGGAVRFTGHLQVARAVFENNTALLQGGALGADDALGGAAPTLSILHSRFDGNSASGDGGAVDASYAVGLSIRESSFTSNASSLGWGGAVSLSSSGSTIVDSFFEENTAWVGGAVAALGNGLQEIRRTTFHVNGAHQGGAANLGVATIANATFHSNGAEVGAALAQVSSTDPLTINNATFVFNSGSGANPSAIRAEQVTMSNTVLQGNGLGATPSCKIASMSSRGYNMADDDSCGLNDAHDWPVASAPVVEDLGAMNGGLMPTNAPLAGSPLIEGGNPATPGSGAGSCERHDQRQVKRPAAADPGISPAVCDIGAVEVCTAPASAPDADHDGIPDVCDGDEDGDGCLNERDQHPRLSSAAGGPVLNACGPNTTWSYFEGTDHDRDGLLDCEDDDDDDDGLADDVDPCPLLSGSALCAQLGQSPCAPEWFTCRTGGCNMQILKFQNIPDPERSIILEHYDVVNERFYAAAPPRSTAAATIQALAGGRVAGGVSALQRTATSAGASAAVASADGPVIWRVEVWSRGTSRGDPGKRLGVVTELRERDIIAEALDTGNIISILLPYRSGVPVRLATAWAVGSTGAQMPDADGDGRPDGFDNCPYTPNRPQADANRNGVGDACELNPTREERQRILADIVARGRAAGLGSGVVNRR